METKYLRINPADNVAVAIVNLPEGEHLSVDGIEITLNEDIPAGHKFALKDFAEGENVIKVWLPYRPCPHGEETGRLDERNEYQDEPCRTIGIYL